MPLPPDALSIPGSTASYVQGNPREQPRLRVRPLPGLQSLRPYSERIPELPSPEVGPMSSEPEDSLGQDNALVSFYS